MSDIVEITEEQAKELIRAKLENDFNGCTAAMARSLDLSPSAIANQLSGAQGVKLGPKLLASIGATKERRHIYYIEK